MALRATAIELHDVQPGGVVEAVDLELLFRTAAWWLGLEQRRQSCCYMTVLFGAALHPYLSAPQGYGLMWLD